jgi:hypothetical protein
VLDEEEEKQLHGVAIGKNGIGTHTPVGTEILLKETLDTLL